MIVPKAAAKAKPCSMAAFVMICVATIPPVTIGKLTMVSCLPIIGIRTSPQMSTANMERIAVATVRHSAINSRKLMVVPMEKTTKSTDHLPASASPAFLMMSGGMSPAMKQARKRNKLTNTAETFALVATPKTSPIPKNKRQISM